MAIHLLGDTKIETILRNFGVDIEKVFALAIATEVET